VLEIAFIGLVAITSMAIFFVLNYAAERKSTADRRFDTLSASDSGVRLVPSRPVAPPETGLRSQLDNWFDVAVRRSGMEASPAGVVAVMVLLATLLGGAIHLWKDNLWLTLVAATLGFLIPLAVVVYASRRFRWQLQQQIPDAFRMLAGSVRAGQTLDQAIEFYAERGSKPLADEFAHCAGLMRLGMSPFAALQATAARVRLLDFDLLVSTVGLYTQTGGNLVLMLERLADSVRDRNLYRGQFFAATAQGRVVAIALGAAAPLILIVYLLSEPEHVQAFLASTRGWTVLLGCAVLEVIGIIWLWRLLRVNY
jgi:tight adherence protein B